MKYILFLLLFLGEMTAQAQLIDSATVYEKDTIPGVYTRIDCPLFVILDKEEDYGMLLVRVPAHVSELRFELYTCDTASTDLRCREANTRIFTWEPSFEEERFWIRLNEADNKTMIHVNYNLFSNGELIRSCRKGAL